MAVSSKNLKIEVNSCEYSSPIPMATYPPFTKGTPGIACHAMHFKGGVFVTIMAELTRHFVWLVLRLACAEALLVHRLWWFSNRLTGVCKEPMAACLMAVRCLNPGQWDSINYLCTSPKPKEAQIRPQILHAGIGAVKFYRIAEEDEDQVVPAVFL